MKSKQKNFFTCQKPHDLPEIEKFKKLSFISLEPNQIESKPTKLKNESFYTKENYLSQNCCYYMSKFREVSNSIILEKFGKINTEIENLLFTLKDEKSYETFFHSLILNTDQNEDIFFEQLEAYFKEKNEYEIEKLYDYSFNEIKNLFKNLYNNNEEKASITDISMDTMNSAQKVIILINYL